jgi:hypothetical protein
VCTIYDALYVALAEALGGRLLTRDARLARGVAGLVDVEVVADGSCGSRKALQRVRAAGSHPGALR